MTQFSDPFCLLVKHDQPCFKITQLPDCNIIDQNTDLYFQTCTHVFENKNAIARVWIAYINRQTPWIGYWSTVTYLFKFDCEITNPAYVNRIRSWNQPVRNW